MWIVLLARFRFQKAQRFYCIFGSEILRIQGKTRDSLKYFSGADLGRS